MMRWIKPTSSATFKLTLSTPLNYITEEAATIKADSLEAIFNSQSTSAETEFITVTLDPSTLDISLQPPQIVYVGEYF